MPMMLSSQLFSRYIAGFLRHSPSDGSIVETWTENLMHVLGAEMAGISQIVMLGDLVL